MTWFMAQRWRGGEVEVGARAGVRGTPLHPIPCRNPAPRVSASAFLWRGFRKYPKTHKA